jgi:hypothetical protein
MSVGVILLFCIGRQWASLYFCYIVSAANERHCNSVILYRPPKFIEQKFRATSNAVLGGHKLKCILNGEFCQILFCEMTILNI